MKPLPLYVEHKKAHEDLIHLHRRVMVQFSFKKISTFRDLLISLGHSAGEVSYAIEVSQQAQVLTSDFIKTYTKNQLTTLDTYYDNLKLYVNNNLHNSIEEHDSWIESNYTSTDTCSERLTTITKDETRSTCEHRVEDNIITGPTISTTKSRKLPPSSRISKYFRPFYWQTEAATDLFYRITEGNKHGIHLQGQVGCGKTAIMGMLLDALRTVEFLKGKTHSPWPIVVVTPPTVIEQFKLDLKEFFDFTDDEITVINIEQLRSRMGELFLKEIVHVVRGEETIEYKWHNVTAPAFLCLDEDQKVKNERSIQSRIMQSWNDRITSNKWLVGMSATPWCRISETKVISVASGVMFSGSRLAAQSPLTNSNFGDFAKSIAAPHDPDEYSPAAMRKYMKYMDDYIVHVKNVRSQFRAYNSVVMLDFKTNAERNTYNQAYEHYLILCAKAKKKGGAEGRFEQLVADLKFAQTAEMIHAPYTAEWMYKSVMEGDPIAKRLLAAVGAFRFKGAIAKCTSILVNDYNVPREQISLIWGGGKQESKKQKAKKKVTGNEKLMDALADMGIELDDMGLGESVTIMSEEEKAMYNDETLDLGPQSRDERERQIRKFQEGKSLYCLFTYKAGGVGLSLPHTDRFTSFKCRRKESSGYVYEEDIPFVSTRPRVFKGTPVFSPQELVQGFGRCPRVVSLSDTHQIMAFFRGTVEERAAKIVSVKLRCLREVVLSNEHWQDIILGGYVRDDERTSHEMKEIRENNDYMANTEDDFVNVAAEVEAVEAGKED